LDVVTWYYSFLKLNIFELKRFSSFLGVGHPEDTALLLGGKKENLNKGYFDRLGTVLKLNEKQTHAVYKRLPTWLPEATKQIDCSFLSEDNKNRYKELITARAKLFI
jgi:serine/threonine-protein kinase HipA